jgi:UDP-GlcNAc:undecaprenyl-phosphate GlcNAc-1-phosphate transferase
LAIGSLVIISIGIIDDIYRIDAYRKLIFQGIAAALAVAAGARAPIENAFLSALLAFLWLIALPNAFNLIDGLDGLCTRVAIFSSLALFALGGSTAAAALAGACIGFLPFNLRPARMFLGDTGALFIGFSLGVISLDTLSRIPTPKGTLSVLLIFALPLADAATAFLRRAAKGKNPFSPDREHFHHKLVDRGFSHKEASLILSLISLALCSIAVAV